MSNEDKGDGPAFSEMMIRRHEDMEPAAGAEAPAAEIEAREEMTEARRSRRAAQGGRLARRRRRRRWRRRMGECWKQETQ